VAALQRLHPEALVYEACSAAEALESVRQLPVSLDLALVDLFMPDMDGFGFLRQLCQAHPELKIAVLSGSDSTAHVEKALQIGAAGFISKAVAEHEFANALNIICAGGIYPPPGKRRVDAGDTEPGADQLDQSAALTVRQREIFDLLGHGLSNKGIARELGLSENTVKVHVSAILRTLGLDNRTQAGLLAGKIQAIQ
jgi:DNA-binding NarL/FixJ family response regulator